MKKLAIAGASVALAAIPAISTFAAPVTTTTDTLTLTVGSGCSITGSTRTDTTAAFGTVTPGNTSTDGTDPITITCNGAWTLTPTIQTALSISGDGTTSVIASGTATSGATSNWSLTLSTQSTPVDNNFSSANTVNGTNKVSGTAAVADASFTPSYTVYVAPGQAPGSYSGTVLYTVAP